MRDKVLVAQGGGPTVVINQSLVGVVLEARKFQHVAADLRRPPRRARHRRRGPGRPHPRDQPQSRDGRPTRPPRPWARPATSPTAPTARRSSRSCRRTASATSSISAATIRSTPCASSPRRRRPPSYDLRCIHIPKTIDNDLVVNDHCPGYPSAARFVAQAFMGANLDNRSLPGVYIAVVMGRHAGWLTAAAALGQKYDDDGPHLIYLPERDFVARPLPRRREGRDGPPRPLHRRGLRGHPRRERHRDRGQARQAGRARRPRQRRSSPAPARWPTC